MYSGKIQLSDANVIDIFLASDHVSFFTAIALLTFFSLRFRSSKESVKNTLVLLSHVIP
jgi:hypothetical protein